MRLNVQTATLKFSNIFNFPRKKRAEWQYEWKQRLSMISSTVGCETSSDPDRSSSPWRWSSKGGKTYRVVIFQAVAISGPESHQQQQKAFLVVDGKYPNVKSECVAHSWRNSRVTDGCALRLSVFASTAQWEYRRSVGSSGVSEQAAMLNSTKRDAETDL